MGGSEYRQGEGSHLNFKTNRTFCEATITNFRRVPDLNRTASMSLKSFVAITIASLWASCASVLWAQVKTFDLPRLDEIRIDGDFSDWENRPGFGVEVLLQEEGTLKSAEDHNVHFRAGWNQEGILILVTVQDDNWVEYPEKVKYYSADVVELFLAAKRGDDDVCQWYITPGMTDQVDQPGVRFRELRRGPTKGMPSELKVFRERLSPNKYRMELLAPWSCIGKEGVAGTKAAFQIWVNDKDQGSRRKRYMSIFYPAKGASYATNAMHNIRLSNATAPSLRISALGQYDTKRFQPFVRLWATAERAGKNVTIKQGNTELGTAVLKATDPAGRSTAKLYLPPAPAGHPYRELRVYLDDQPVNSVSLPYSSVIGDLREVYENRSQYRELFKLDEPWVDLDDAPLLQRHRGLAAAGLNLLEQSPPPSTANEMEILSTTVEMLAAVENGHDYFGKQRNGLWGYYFCKADGTGQRFSMTIPKEFDPQRSYPLFVSLHGNGGRPLPSKAESRQSDYFQIRPWGRGDISFFGLGEVDVLESIRQVMRWYPIDRDRICLGGHSMGGNATWDLASKYTNLFACMAPKAGRSGDDYYENFRHLPALIQHGAKDSSQPVDFGRYTVSRLRQLGFSVIYKEFPDDGHGIRDPYPVEQWFVKQRRPRNPEIITYTCDTTKSGEIYWARIRRFADPHRPATIDARVHQRTQHTNIDLTLSNIEVIELNLNDLPGDKAKALRMKAGTTEIVIDAPHPDRVTLVLQNDAWRRVDSWSPPVTGMRPYVPGGAGNLYSGEPLLIVYPTTGREENRKLMQLAAQRLVHYGGSGGDMITGRVPIKADEDVTQSDIRNRNLILIGGPKYNLVSRKLANRLPVQVNPQNQFIVPGHSHVDVDKSTMLLTTFNPLAPKRLIHLIWQDEIPEAMRDRYPQFAKNLLPGANGRYPHNIPDLQIRSQELSLSIQRQFSYGWSWKQMTGGDRQLSQRVQQEGVNIAKLRLMRTKAGTDFAISPSFRSWGSTSSRPPTLDQFRYRNYRITTFKANIEGKVLQNLLADSTSWRLDIYPTIHSETLEPERNYSIVAPEGILWAVKTIKNDWTDVQAGPDLLKSEMIRDFYGARE